MVAWPRQSRTLRSSTWAAPPRAAEAYATSSNRDIRCLRIRATVTRARDFDGSPHPWRARYGRPLDLRASSLRCSGTVLLPLGAWRIAVMMAIALGEMRRRLKAAGGGDV